MNVVAFLWFLSVAIAFNVGTFVGWVGKKGMRRLAGDELVDDIDAEIENVVFQRKRTCSDKDCTCIHNVVSCRAGDPGKPDFMWCEDCEHRI